MSDTCKTVLIVTDNGPVRINHSDFDANVHELHEGETVENGNGSDEGDNGGNEAGTGSGGTTINAIPIRHGVMESNGKFFIVDQNDGKRLTGKGIAAKGYADNGAAWAAITALIAASNA